MNPTVTSSTKGTYIIWRERHPNQRLYLTANTLANVRRDIIKKQRLTNIELEEIRKSVLNEIRKKFGGNIKPFRILVYTNAQCQLQDKDLDKFCLHQTQDEAQLITKFIEELNENIVAVDNKTTVPAERERNQNVILALVDKVRRQNKGSVYTSEMFSKALEEHKKMQIDAAREGWSPELLDTVDMFIAADPDIVTRKGELGRKVYEYQMQKRETELREQFNEKLESKMAELDAEKRRIGEIEEKQKQAEEKLRLKMEEDQKSRQLEQKELMKMLEEEKEMRKDSEEKWLAHVKEEQKKQRKIQEEEKRKFDEEQKRLQEETTRIQREKEELEKKTKEAENEKHKEIQLLQDKMRQLEQDSEENLKKVQAIGERHEGIFSSVTGYLKSVWDNLW
ncbi:Cortactin-binding protein 2 [Holothuria leucospilota]|uniref:Cortactin-binding protein 2 n=1 Tax=Holothuria leucospilota TaxID=206669 RepID=A0A9Q1H5Q3_HOLLE|nr:Cortactin-binding protein 2 [Holothuria leucospilota]